MTVRRWRASAVLASLLVVAVQAPALAHANFDVRAVPAGASETFVLRVPIETDSTNAFVDVLVPAGWTVDACEGAPGWQCESSGRDDGATVVNLSTDDAKATFQNVEQIIREIDICLIDLIDEEDRRRLPGFGGSKSLS